MKRFKYEIVINKWNTGGIIAKHKFNAVTIHHSAVRSQVADYNAEKRIKAYTIWHKKKGNKGIAYHFVIPADNSDIIYCTNWVSGHTWHNSNYIGNKYSLAVMMDGNFQVENPTEKQLQKLKQILDDLNSNWFSKNGWYSFEKDIVTRDANVKRTFSSNITVSSLHTHKEVAQPGHGTACPGNSLQKYIVDYRVRGGVVDWGNINPPVPPVDPCNEYKKEIEQLKKENTELKNKNNELSTKLSTSLKKLERALKELQKKVEEISNLKDKVHKLELANQKLQSRLDKCRVENEELKKKVGILDKIILFLKKIIQWLAGKRNKK